MTTPAHSPSQAPAHAAGQRNQGVTGTLLRLHLKMWGRSFKNDRTLTATAAIIVIFGLLAAIGMGYGAYALIADEGEVRVLPLFMAAGAMAYVLMVFMWPSNENHLDPRKFSTLPVTAKQLFPGLTGAAFLQSRALLAVVACLIMAGHGAAGIREYDTSHPGLMSTLWVLACLVQAAMTVLLGEALGSLTSALANRQWSERLGYAVSFLFLGLIMAMNFAANGIEDYGVFLSLGSFFAWTPFGAAAGAVASWMSGNLAVGIAQLVIAAVTIAACLWLWRTAIRYELRNPVRGGASEAKANTGDFLVGWASPTPRGAVYSRCLRYWRREVRYSYQAIVYFLLGGMLLVLGVVQESGAHWFTPFFMLMGLLMVNGNDFGMDGPSNWVNMVSGIRARDLIDGRLLASLTVIGPIFLLSLIGLGAIEGFRPIWAGVSVLALCSLVQVLGMAPALALRFPYPTSQPGTSPMKNRSGNSSNAFILSLVGMLGQFLPLLPGLILLIVDLHDATSWSDASSLTAIGIAVQIVISGAIGFFCYRWAIKNTAERWPRVFTKVRNWA